MRESIAALLVPVLTAGILIHKVLAQLQIALFNRTTLWVVAPVLLASLCVGLLAAAGPRLLRVAILAACILLLLDTSFPLVEFFVPGALTTDG